MALLKANAVTYNGTANLIAQEAAKIEQAAINLIESAAFKDQIATAMVKIDFREFMWWSNSGDSVHGQIQFRRRPQGLALLYNDVFN